MVALAQTQLTTRFSAESPTIEVVQLERQTVAGINLRLTFIYDNQQRCQLTAFKPIQANDNQIQSKNLACQGIEEKHTTEPSDVHETKDPIHQRCRHHPRE